MGATVEITGPGVINGSFQYGDITFYGWTFSVVVNGQAGVYTVYVDTNNPADGASVAQDAVQDLEANPGDLEPISMNDPGTGDQDRGDEDRGDGDRGDGDRGGDDDDGMLADGASGAGDGDSV